MFFKEITNVTERVRQSRREENMFMESIIMSACGFIIALFWLVLSSSWTFHNHPRLWFYPERENNTSFPKLGHALCVNLFSIWTKNMSAKHFIYACDWSMCHDHVHMHIHVHKLNVSERSCWRWWITEQNWKLDAIQGSSWLTFGILLRLQRAAIWAYITSIVHCFDYGGYFEKL